MNRALRADFPLTLDELVQEERLLELRDRSREISAGGTPLSEVRLLEPLVRPPKIWCIGLNYIEHASDLSEKSPEEPASFMGPSFSIVGPGETTDLPSASERVTGEGELAIVIGRKCRDISEDEAEEAIGAFVPAIQMFVGYVRAPAHTYSRPNRRFPKLVGQVPDAAIPPARSAHPNCWCAIDTSASMSSDSSRPSTCMLHKNLRVGQ